MSAIRISQADQLRDTVLHAHTDLRVALKMLRGLRWIAAWRKLQQGYHRLGTVLDTTDNYPQNDVDNCG